jgi:hypothetical protein
MAFLGVAGAPLAPPALGFDRVRRTKKHPAPDEKSVWAARLGGIFGAGAPKQRLGGL